MNELITASALSRSTHSVFDDDAVWKGRLEEAERIQRAQRMDTAHSVLPIASLSLPALLAEPPLPSKAEVAALCMSYIEVEWQRPPLGSFFWSHEPPHLPPPPPSRVTSIQRLPHTRRYLLQILTDRPLQESVEHVEFVLAYNLQQDRWEVQRKPLCREAWQSMSAADVDDNLVGLDEQASEQPPELPAPATSVSSCKQRYIDLLGCSEHVHRRCFRLLPPSPTLSHTQPVPAVALPPLPLCCLCRTIIARCFARAHVEPNAKVRSHYRVTNVIRIDNVTYEATVTTRRTTMSPHAAYRFTDQIAYTHSADDEAERYRVVGHHHVLARCTGECNVCELCQCGISESGGGHHESCRVSSTGSWCQTASGRLV